MASLYLIRSYNQPKKITPNSSMITTPRSTRRTTLSNTERSGDVNAIARDGENVKGRKGINYGNAQQFEIWQVARAASAAPFYFEPLKIPIPGASGHLLFTDGGFNHANNPTLLGTHEIEDDHGGSSIGIVVSVGTARKVKASQGAGLRQRVEEIAYTATDPEKVHQEMEEKSDKEGFPYFRLNHPDGLSIELDEWKPKQTPFTKTSGSKTLEDIRSAFDGWAGKVDNVKLFQDCAEALVRRKRARATDAAKWERYAVGAEYGCHFKECDSESGLFANRDKFKDHLRKRHQVPEPSLCREADKCRTYWKYQKAPS